MAGLPTSPAAPRPWVLWLLIVALFSLVVALSVGILKTCAGANLADAVLGGGAAFAGSTGFCLAVLAAVRDLRR